jgi:MtN3 and saliva related transmembrane protein
MLRAATGRRRRPRRRARGVTGAEGSHPMISVELIGYLAAALTTAAFAPQVWRTWRTRSAGDLSLATLLAQGTGNAAWFTYAVLNADLPLTLANAFTFLLMAALVAMKLADMRRRPAAA